VGNGMAGSKPAVNMSAAQSSALEDREDREDRLLAAARATFPGWQVLEALGGVIAVPAGCPVLYAASVDVLVMKLRSAESAKLEDLGNNPPADPRPGTTPTGPEVCHSHSFGFVERDLLARFRLRAVPPVTALKLAPVATAQLAQPESVFRLQVRVGRVVRYLRYLWHGRGSGGSGYPAVA
jgi:hypothetical protein